VPDMDEILADLAADGDDLDGLVSGIDQDQWRLPTPAPGWTIARQVGHLASSDWLAALAATDAAAFRARQAELAGDFDDAVEAGADEFAADPPDRLLERWPAPPRGRTRLGLVGLPVSDAAGSRAGVRC
jgi:enediyne biosynthesis protein E11